MRVLVTGGAGFIGSNLVRNLLDEGLEPVVLDNLSTGFRENLVPDVPFMMADVRDREAVLSVMEGCTVVFHLAASVGNGRSIRNPYEDSEVNLIGMLNILEAARRHSLNRIVFSSSAGIFGELKTLPISEDHPQEPDSPYGVSKLAAEKMCLAYNKLHGMQNICLRYFNVFGPNQRFDAYGNVIPIFAHRLLRGEPLTVYGDGEQTRDFVNVRDVAHANIAAAMANGVKGAFNIGSGTCISINALARMMQEVAGVRVEIQHAPPRQGDVRHSLADIRAAQASLGFQLGVAFEQGIADYWGWVTRDEVTRKQTELGL